MAYEGRGRDDSRAAPMSAGHSRTSYSTDLPLTGEHRRLTHLPPPPHLSQTPDHSNSFDRNHRLPPPPSGGRFNQSPPPLHDRRAPNWDRPSRPLSPAPSSSYGAYPPRHKTEIWDESRSSGYDGAMSLPSRNPPSQFNRDTYQPPAQSPREWGDRGSSNGALGSPIRPVTWTPHDWDPRDSRRLPPPAPPAPPPLNHASDWDRRRTTSWGDDRGRELAPPTGPRASHHMRPWESESRDPPPRIPPPAPEGSGRWRKDNNDSYVSRVLPEPAGYRQPISQLPPRQNDLGHGRYPASPTVSSHYSPMTPSSSHGQPPIRELYDSRERRAFPPLSHDDMAPSTSRSSSRSASRHGEESVGHPMGNDRHAGHSNKNTHRPPPIELREVKKEPVDDMDWRSVPPPVHSRHSSGTNVGRWAPPSSHPPVSSRSTMNTFPGSPHVHPSSGHPSPFVERGHQSHGSGPSSPLRPLLPPISTDVRLHGPPAQPSRPSSSASFSSHQPPHLHHLPPLARVSSSEMSLGSRSSMQSSAAPYSLPRPATPQSRPPSRSIAETTPLAAATETGPSHVSSSRPTTGSAPQGSIPAFSSTAVPETSNVPSAKSPSVAAQAIHTSPNRLAVANPASEIREVNGSLEILKSPVPGALRNALEHVVAVEKSFAMDIDDDAGSETSVPLGSARQRKENGANVSPAKRSRRSRAKNSANARDEFDRMDLDDSAEGQNEGGFRSGRTASQSLTEALRQHITKRASPDDCFGFDVVETVLKRNKLMVDQPSSRNRTSPDQLVFDVMHSPGMEDAADVNDRIQPYLIEKVSTEVEDAAEKARGLKEQYLNLNKQWQAYCQELDRQAITEASLKTPIPSTPIDTLPPLSATLPTGRATRRTAGNLGLMADAVRSEAEFEQVMATLGNEDLADPNFLSIRNAARIPNMISTIPRQAAHLKVQFDDRNGEVDYPEQFYDIATALGDWTEEEKEIFMDQFALNGKQFGKVAEHLRHKTAEQCVLFYYIQKKSVVNFRDVMSRGARGRRKRGGYGRRGFALLSGKQKGNALLTDIRTRMGDEEAADSPGGSPKQNTDVELPSGRRQSRRNAGSITPALLDIESGSRTRASRAAGAAANSRLRRGTPENSDGDTPMQESGAESGDSNAEGDSGTPAESRPKTRRARKPTQAADGSVNIPPTRRKGLASSYWSTAEKATFVEQLEQHGRNWAAIATVLTTKSATQCRNYFQNNLRDSKSTFAEIANAADIRNNQPRKVRGGKRAKENAGTRDPSESDGTPNPLENATVQWNGVSNALQQSDTPAMQTPSSFYGHQNGSSSKPDGDSSYAQSGARTSGEHQRPGPNITNWNIANPETYAAISPTHSNLPNGEYARPGSSKGPPFSGGTPLDKMYYGENRVPEHHHSVPHQSGQSHIHPPHHGPRGYGHDHMSNGANGPPMNQPIHPHYDRPMRVQPQYASPPPNPYASFSSATSPMSPVGPRQTPTAPHSPFTQQSRTSSWNHNSASSPTNQHASPTMRNGQSPQSGRRPNPTSPSSGRSFSQHPPRDWLPTSQPTTLPPFGSKPLPAGATRSSSHHHSNSSVGGITPSSLPPTPTNSQPTRAA